MPHERDAAPTGSGRSKFARSQGHTVVWVEASVAVDVETPLSPAGGQTTAHSIQRRALSRHQSRELPARRFWKRWRGSGVRVDHRRGIRPPSLAPPRVWHHAQSLPFGAGNARPKLGRGHALVAEYVCDAIQPVPGRTGASFPGTLSISAGRRCGRAGSRDRLHSPQPGPRSHGACRQLRVLSLEQPAPADASRSPEVAMRGGAARPARARGFTRGLVELLPPPRSTGRLVCWSGSGRVYRTLHGGGGWEIGTEGWKRAVAKEHRHLALHPGYEASELRDFKERGWRERLEQRLLDVGKTMSDGLSDPANAAGKIDLAVALRRECFPYAWIRHALAMRGLSSIRGHVFRREHRTA